MRRLAIFALLISVGCSGSATDIEATIELEPLTLPVSLYIVENRSADGPSSDRTIAELEEIASRMTEIWREAGVVLDINVVGAITVPSDVIGSVADRNGNAFLLAAREGRFEVPDPGVLAGFYVPSAGGANGFAPSGSRVFFVTDKPTVHDERVSSHEIGHLLGLHHTSDDERRLMFSGTNGMVLSNDEIAAARYVARGILDGFR